MEILPYAVSKTSVKRMGFLVYSYTRHKLPSCCMTGRKHSHFKARVQRQIHCKNSSHQFRLAKTITPQSHYILYFVSICDII